MMHLFAGLLLFVTIHAAGATAAHPLRAQALAALETASARPRAAAPRLAPADRPGRISSAGTTGAGSDATPGAGSGGDGSGCGTINGIDPCAIQDSVNFENVKKSSTGMVDNFNMILVGLVVGIAVLVGLSIAILLMIHNRNTRKIQELHSGMARLAEGYGFALAIPLFLGIVGMLVKAAGVVK